MSHSPLHQRLHLRLAMRQNFSSPTLSPLPPYPVSSLPKGPALPVTAPHSPELRPTEPTAQVHETEAMRATHVRPRTAPASPERPDTAVSTRSTIRQVQPSPESLSEAFANGFADGGTPEPRPASSFEPFPPFNSAHKQDSAENQTEHGDSNDIHIPSTEPSHPNVTLRRGGSPRKSRSCSPQKSRSLSPIKRHVRTPTLPAHQESPSSSYSTENLDAPDTPTPVTREQQQQAYAPLQIRRPFAEANKEGEPAEGRGTHARLADYMRNAKGQQRSGASSSLDENSKVEGEGAGSEPAKRAVPSVPHIVSAMAGHGDSSQKLSPFSAAQRQTQKEKEKEPARHASVSRRSEASGASVASKHSIFSTPGRDEMERKKPIVEEDEGPFASAKCVQDLEQTRRKVSEGTRDGEGKAERRLCGMRCVVM